MKYVGLFISFLVVLSSCKEKDLTDDNPPLPGENVQMKVSFLYGGEGYSEDSVITNNLGNRFYITDVKFIATNLFFINRGDSLVLDTGYYKFNNRDVIKRIAFLEGGGYTGFYGFRMGLDSTEVANLNPQLARGDAFTDQDMVRNDGFGFNALVIKGRAFDPADPADTTGNIPFEYNIGGYFLIRKVRSDQINFSVSNTTVANLILNVDPEPIFNDFDIVARPTVTSDFSDPVDFGIAQMMLDSLQIRLF